MGQRIEYRENKEVHCYQWKLKKLFTSLSTISECCYSKVQWVVCAKRNQPGLIIRGCFLLLFVFYLKSAKDFVQRYWNTLNLCWGVWVLPTHCCSWKRARYHLMSCEEHSSVIQKMRFSIAVTEHLNCRIHFLYVGQSLKD